MADKRASPVQPSHQYTRRRLSFWIAGIDSDASVIRTIRQPILTTAGTRPSPELKKLLDGQLDDVKQEAAELRKVADGISDAFKGVGVSGVDVIKDKLKQADAELKKNLEAIKPKVGAIKAELIKELKLQRSVIEKKAPQEMRQILALEKGEASV